MNRSPLSSVAVQDLYGEAPARKAESSVAARNHPNDGRNAPHERWAICTPLAWALAWVEHRGAPRRWIKEARRESRRVERAGGFLVVLSWPGGLFCFVEWAGLPPGPPVLSIDDELASAAFRHAQAHAGEHAPLIRLMFSAGAPAPVLPLRQRQGASHGR